MGYKSKKNENNSLVPTCNCKELEKSVEEYKVIIDDKINEYANTHKKDIINVKTGEIEETIIIVKPIVIESTFFNSIFGKSAIIPVYDPTKLGIIYDYYIYLNTKINEHIGQYPPSISSFCKLAGISIKNLREYRCSNDENMSNLVEKIYEQIGDENISLSQMGILSEKMTMFKLKTQNEMVEKVQPNVNISLKESISKEDINNKLEKYKKIIELGGNFNEK